MFRNVRRGLIILLLILIVGAVLRFSYLGRLSLWYDEAFSIDLAQRDLSQIVAGEKNIPPLYHFVLHYWMIVFGRSESAARALSAIFGFLSIVAVYGVTKQLLSKKVALLTATLMAVAPFQVMHSQDARMYSLVLLLTLGSMYFYLRLKRGPSTSLWIGYYLLSLGSIYTHYFAAFVLVAQNVDLIMGWRRHRNLLGRWFAVQALLVVGFVPWVWSLMHAIAHSSRQVTHLLLRIPRTLLIFGLGYSAPVTDMYSRHDLVGFIRENLALLSLAGVVMGGLAVAGFVRALKEARSSGLVLAYLLTPFVCAALASIKVPLLEERYFIIASPPFYMLLSLGLMALRPRQLRVLWFAGLLGLMVFSLNNYYFNPRFGKGQWREVAEYVEGNCQNEDVVTFYPHYIKTPFEYYLTKDIPITGGSKGDFNGINRLMDDVCGRFRRTWLVLAHCPHTKGDIVEMFKRRFFLIEHRDFPVSSGIEVYLFDLRDSGREERLLNDG